jgi:hypothetical protein
MPIRREGTKLVDDSRTFESEELTEIWEWLDSLDSQPLRARDGARLHRPPLTFNQGKYVFRERIFSVAKCSDGRELLGSIIGVIPRAAMTPTQLLLTQLRNF